MYTPDLHDNTRQHSHRSWFDYLGIGLSTVCLIHCLTLPLTILFAPFVASWLLNDQFFHTYLLAFILPVTILAFIAGWLRHHSHVVLVCGAIGVTLVSVAALQAAWLDHSLFSANMEKLLASMGGFMLILGHLLNLRYTKRVSTGKLL
jgi:hypothetical protein